MRLYLKRSANLRYIVIWSNQSSSSISIFKATIRPKLRWELWREMACLYPLPWAPTAKASISTALSCQRPWKASCLRPFVHSPWNSDLFACLQPAGFSFKSTHIAGLITPCSFSIRGASLLSYTKEKSCELEQANIAQILLLILNKVVRNSSLRVSRAPFDGGRTTNPRKCIRF